MIINSGFMAYFELICLALILMVKPKY